MRLAVVGSRDFVRLDRVEHELWKLAPAIDCVVSGGARGVDATAERWARDHSIPVVSFRVFNRHDGWFNIERWTWDGDGQLHAESPTRLGHAHRSFRAAAFVRNGFIVEFSDKVFAFWDGVSNGTRDSIHRAHDLGVPLEVFRA